MNQKKFNELLKSQGFKIISINYFSNYYTYYIRKLEKEKITEKDFNNLNKIGDLLNYKCDGYYIEFDIKLKFKDLIISN